MEALTSPNETRRRWTRGQSNAPLFDSQKVETNRGPPCPWALTLPTGAAPGDGQQPVAHPGDLDARRAKQSTDAALPPITEIADMPFWSDVR